MSKSKYILREDLSVQDLAMYYRLTDLAQICIDKGYNQLYHAIDEISQKFWHDITRLPAKSKYNFNDDFELNLVRTLYMAGDDNG